MPVEDAPSGRERRQARRASTIENFRDWYENEGGQDVMDRIQGLDFGEGQVFDRQIGPGRLSVNLPTEYGDPKVGSIADFLRDPQAWGDQAEQDQWDRALRASYTIPIGGGGAEGGLVEASKAVADAGRGKDTELIHVTKDELQGLMSLLGPMTRNPETGLREGQGWEVALAAIIQAVISSGVQAATQPKSAGFGVSAGDVSGQTRAVSPPATILPEGAEVDVTEIEFGATPGFGNKDDAGIMKLLQQMGGGGGGGGGSNLRNEQASVLSDEDWENLGMARGGPVGTTDNVFYFSSPQIQQMRMAPDPMTQNMGNMLGQQQQGGAPVPATVPQIQQMALGGPVTAKKH